MSKGQHIKQGKIKGSLKHHWIETSSICIAIVLLIIHICFFSPYISLVFSTFVVLVALFGFICGSFVRAKKHHPIESAYIVIFYSIVLCWYVLEGGSIISTCNDSKFPFVESVYFLVCVAVFAFSSYMNLKQQINTQRCDRSIYYYPLVSFKDIVHYDSIDLWKFSLNLIELFSVIITVSSLISSSGSDSESWQQVIINGFYFVIIYISTPVSVLALLKITRSKILSKFIR